MGRYQILAGVVAVIALVAAAALYMHGAYVPVLQPHGPVAAGEKWILILTLLLCSIVVIPVFVMLFSFAWMFRADRPRSRRFHMPDWDHYSTEVEIIWWVVPSIIIAILAGVAWRSSHEYDPYRPVGTGDPLVIQVVALDWKWLFIYPQQGIAVVNSVEFPVNVPIRFVLTADAPMNSFWIPSLGGQIMVMPGMTTQLNLLADDPGIFRGLSGNLSGVGFSGMTFEARAVSQADFDAWVSDVRAAHHPGLTASTYSTLAQPSADAPVTFYSSVEEGVYDGISMKYMIPGHAMMDGMAMPGMTNEMQMPPVSTSTHPYNL